MKSMFQKRYDRYLERIGTQSLAEYFDIQTKPGQTLHFDCRKHQEPYANILRFIVHFQSQNPCPTLDIPDDLQRMIDSYNHNYIRITLHIEFPESYPFKPQIWHLVDVEHNLCISYNLREYYDRITKNHNEQYAAICWSPAIDIQHDILYFIERIHHFDYVLEIEKANP